MREWLLRVLMRPNAEPYESTLSTPSRLFSTTQLECVRIGAPFEKQVPPSFDDAAITCLASLFEHNDRLGRQGHALVGIVVVVQNGRGGPGTHWVARAEDEAEV